MLDDGGANDLACSHWHVTNPRIIDAEPTTNGELIITACAVCPHHVRCDAFGVRRAGQLALMLIKCVYPCLFTD